MYKEENSSFKEEWEDDYSFILLGDKAFLFNKDSNIKCHHKKITKLFS